MQSTIPYRTLVRTGERVSAIGLGGWHLGLERVDEPLSLRIIRTAIDRGINFLDNCWDYNDGASETRMGKALRDGYRQKVFLMRHGRPLPQLRQTRLAGVGETGNRRPRDEADGQRHHSQIEDCVADRVSSLCAELADFGGDHR